MSSPLLLILALVSSVDGWDNSNYWVRGNEVPTHETEVNNYIYDPNLFIHLINLNEKLEAIWEEYDKSTAVFDFGTREGPPRATDRYYVGWWRKLPDGSHDEYWAVRSVRDSTASDLNQEINTRVKVPLRKNKQTEFMIVRSTPDSRGRYANYTSRKPTNDNTKLILKTAPPVSSEGGEGGAPRCQVVDVDLNRRTSTMDVQLEWDNVQHDLPRPLHTEKVQVHWKNEFDEQKQELKLEENTEPRMLYKGIKPSPSKQVEFTVNNVNIMGKGKKTEPCVLKGPQPPTIEIIKIDISDGYPTYRDFTFSCKNQAVPKKYGEVDEVQVYEDWFEQQDKTARSWSDMKPQLMEVEDVDELDNLFKYKEVWPAPSQFRARARNIIGHSDYSNVVEADEPFGPPTDLKLVRIGVNEEDYSKRDFELTWRNPPDRAKVNPNIRNLLEHRDRKPSEFLSPSPFTSWHPAEPAQLDIDDSTVLDRRHTFLELPDTLYQFRMKVENYIGISPESNNVTIENPEALVNLNLLNINKSESSTEQEPTRDFGFEFDNLHNHDKPNKIIKVKFQYRGTDSSYLLTRENRTYPTFSEPWTDSKLMKVNPDDVHIKKDLMDIRSEYTGPLGLKNFEYSAMQFRVVGIGYVGDTEPSNVVTVEKPYPPKLFFNKMYLIEPRSEEEEEYQNSNGLLPARVFEFRVELSDFNKENSLNKLRQLQLEHRISKYHDGASPAAWQPADPTDVDTNTPIDKQIFYKNLTVNFKKSDGYSAVDFRVIVKGLIGTSDASDSLTPLDGPSPPTELNVIYYGSDVECVTRCELEVDWKKSERAGSYPITEYIIQQRPRRIRLLDTESEWTSNVSVPETGQLHRRQFITFDNNYEYRVIARTIFADSAPSNVIFHAPFRAYHLRVDYRRDPDDELAVLIQLQWEPMADRRIKYYVVQSNLFFEHDERPFVDEVTVPYQQLSVELKKEIEFLNYTKVDKSTSEYYLPEFRVISKYEDTVTLGPTSCTTFLHFSLDEFEERGAALSGYMP